MTISNRKINTGHNSSVDMVTLVAKKNGRFDGKEMFVGKVVKCTKSQARRYLMTDKSMFEIKMD